MPVTYTESWRLYIVTQGSVTHESSWHQGSFFAQRKQLLNFRVWQEIYQANRNVSVSEIWNWLKKGKDCTASWQNYALHRTFESTFTAAPRQRPHVIRSYDCLRGGTLRTSNTSALNKSLARVRRWSLTKQWKRSLSDDGSFEWILRRPGAFPPMRQISNKVTWHLRISS